MVAGGQRRGKVAPVVHALGVVLAPRLVERIDQQAEPPLAQRRTQLLRRVAPAARHRLLPHARQKGLRRLVRLLRRQPHKERQLRARIAAQPGQRLVQRDALQDRGLARARLRQQDEAGVLRHGRADVGQRHALDLPLRSLAAHEDGAVGRRQHGRCLVAARNRHIALLPLLELGVDAQVQQILPLACGLRGARRRVDKLAQRVGQRRRHLLRPVARRHPAGAQRHIGRGQQAKETLGQPFEIAGGNVHKGVGDKVAADKHTAARVDGAAHVRAAAGIDRVASGRVAVGHRRLPVLDEVWMADGIVTRPAHPAKRRPPLLRRCDVSSHGAARPHLSTATPRRPWRGAND